MNISYGQAINQALTEEMRRNKKLICFGLGVNDSLVFLNDKRFREKIWKSKSF